MSQAIRTSPLAEIRTLSMASLFNRLKNPTIGQKFLEKLRDGKADALAEFASYFVPVGLAKSVRIDEDWGTQAIYGIGDPTRPTMVPGNYSVSASMERLQLDGRDNFSFVTSPDYWYSKYAQRQMGNNDWGIYTYMYVHDRDTGGSRSTEIYALMPKSASKAVSANDVMIVHNVQMIGFKYKYLDFVNDLLRTTSGVLSYGRTVAGIGGDEFGVTSGSSAANNSGGELGKT